MLHNRSIVRARSFSLRGGGICVVTCIAPSETGCVGHKFGTAIIIGSSIRCATAMISVKTHARPVPRTCHGGLSGSRVTTVTILHVSRKRGVPF